MVAAGRLHRRPHRPGMETNPPGMRSRVSSKYPALISRGTTDREERALDYGPSHHDPPHAQHGDWHTHGVVDPAIVSSDRGVWAPRGICDGADDDAVAYVTTSLARGDRARPPRGSPADPAVRRTCPRCTGGRHSP